MADTKKSMLSRDMQRAVSAVLREATEPTEDDENPTVTAKEVVKSIASDFGIPKSAHDDLRIFLTQAVKLGQLGNYRNRRGRYGGICRA